MKYRGFGEKLLKIAIGSLRKPKFGAFGVFTKGYLTRKASFELALIRAFASFFNRRLYKS